MAAKALQPSLPSTSAPPQPWYKRAGAHVWDALALLLVLFVLWKVFVLPRNLNVANAYPAPNAVFPKLDGGAFHVTGARGRVLFLDFYATWCEPCKVELPLVERWARAHPSATVVPVDVAEPVALVRTFAHKYDLRDVVLDPNASAQALFAVRGFPTVVAIDPQGRIRAKWEGLNPAIALALSNAAVQLPRAMK